jgi:hypothetical protein
MSLEKIIWAVAFLAAIVFAFVSFDYGGLILVVLGLASGWFVKGDHRKSLLMGAIFLHVGAGALASVPMAGDYLTGIFTNYGAVLNSAGLLVIVMATVERLMPGGD